MTVPGRVEAAALLLSLDPPAWFLNHARGVAEVAAWLAARTARATSDTVDRPLVEAAALLHDVDKLLPADDVARALPHGDGSAAWLARAGYPELGPAVASHPVTRLIDGDCYERWVATASREERIVAYADKRAGQSLEPMADRFASWLARAGHPELGPAVASHPVTRLVDGSSYERWVATASREERIVAYADKRAGQSLEPMADRFASWQRRYPDGWSPDEAAAARRRADELESDVCERAGVDPADVRRLRWTGAALQAARGRA